MIKKILPVSLIAVLVLIWQGVVAADWISAYLLPSPWQVAQSIYEFRSELFSAFTATSFLALQGLVFSFILGNILAITFSAMPLLRLTFLPIAVFFQTVPIIAIAPLLVVWFGFGAPTVRASSAIVCFFPILASTLKGLSLEDPQMNELFQIYKANKWQKLVKLSLPRSLPFILNGLEVGGGLAIIGAIVGEFVGGGGLGAIVDSARTQQRTDVVFAAVFLSSMLGVFLIFCLQTFGRLISRKRPYFHSAL